MKLNYNQDYLQGGQTAEFKIHGEDWLLAQLGNSNPSIIFDVGCNIGEWTKMARTSCPAADIHTFEVVNSTFHKFYHNVKYDDKIYPNGFGLSNKEEQIVMKFVDHNDRISTSLPLLSIGDCKFYGGHVKTGDSYMRDHNIDHIDFLKIDVEGIGNRVLSGFIETLKLGLIGAIQFEYDRTCILERFLLLDYYEMLVPLGFKLGRLKPNGCMFKDYSLFDEDFAGPDYIAVHYSRPDLLSAFSPS